MFYTVREPMPQELASYRNCIGRVRTNWADFCARRSDHLAQQQRFGITPEKTAENIASDLFGFVLDWESSNINYQVHYADILLTNLGIKYLILETKRPGALARHRKAIQAALQQARGYADEQRVQCVGVSDGTMLYAADVVNGGLRNRAYLRLDTAQPDHEELWWLSVQGIYRERPDPETVETKIPPERGRIDNGVALSILPEAQRLHPKYRLPQGCFAYVGDARDPRTWKLPYCLADGSIDARRLPKAIQAILTNYRGAKVSSIPEAAIPDVLTRLAKAAVQAGKMPGQTGKPAAAYRQLKEALFQLDKLTEIGLPED